MPFGERVCVWQLWQALRLPGLATDAVAIQTIGNWDLSLRSRWQRVVV